MSARLLRRVLKEQDEQRLGLSNVQQDAGGGGGDETGEESDSPVAGAPSRNLFDLLDNQGYEEDTVGDSTEDIIEKQQSVIRKAYDAVPVMNYKSKKKKKKNKEIQKSAKFKDEESLDSILEELSIDVKASHENRCHSAKEQNENVIDATKKQGGSSILTVDSKYLKVENELRKIFGSRVVSSFENNEIGGNLRQIHGGRRAIHNPRRTILVTPSSFWPRWDGSLSMELIETKDGLHYFRYLHSAAYSHAQEAFEAAKSANDLNAIASILAHYPYHIESLLTFAEVFKFSGEHQSSADVLAKCLFALECAWHPLFTPMQGNCQLKYIHDTNKPFFTALFCHMKNLDRRGCHRSALEVCKLLLSLDCDDPKGALLCIDYFSLRAEEYRWLEEFVDEYRSDNSLWMFPNFSYSLAFARFFIEHDLSSSSNSTEQTEKASSTDLMKQALMLHPLVLQKLVVKAPLKESLWTQILKNSFFGSAKAGSPTLEHLISIYVERSYLIWRFPELQNLLKEAALQVIESFKASSSEAKDWACVRKEAFSSERNEYSHLLVSDFSDTIPTIPPEELRQFMVGPHLDEIHPADEGDANPQTAHATHEVAGRNAAVVFLESLLPWVHYGERQAHAEDHDQNIQ
ncbi:transcription factor 25 [Dendrobium catenatum]|uniref:Transcription factor 25 n=1 Tax=Dendrobium catenatum TaxID=906689 RepID=A0A2I0W890_9ASPA|nr:transcription factor 25 [Dendrobium catenatum]XP_028553863.1 transcription factor 25 [Dendrobium catenatum]PKU71860.1 hypothetical protein MA16_Dca016313 [Dendrobium catenatum]